jgi:hypothetical protein
MSRDEFLAASPRELDALLTCKYVRDAGMLAALRSDIWNTAMVVSGNEQRFEPDFFLGRSGVAAKHNDADTRRFIEEWERGQIEQPDAETVSAFKARLSTKFKFRKSGEVQQVRK